VLHSRFKAQVLLHGSKVFPPFINQTRMTSTVRTKRNVVSWEKPHHRIIRASILREEEAHSTIEKIPGGIDELKQPNAEHGRADLALCTRLTEHRRPRRPGAGHEPDGVGSLPALLLHQEVGRPSPSRTRRAGCARSRRRGPWRASGRTPCARWRGGGT